MHFYLYDAFLREKKYDVTLARIEGRLFDLGLHGKSEKLTILKSMREVVQQALKRGADTVVVVGNDETLSKVIKIVADSDILLGYIPIGSDNVVARMLGIPEGTKACDVLAGRIIERLDLGKANEALFLSFLNVAAGNNLLLESDGEFHIEPIGYHTVTIFNFGQPGSDPHDGKLEVVLEPDPSDRRSRFGRRAAVTPSRFQIRSLRIKSLGKSLAGYADGQTVIKTPFTVSVIPKKIRVIVGKKRMF